MIDRINKIIVAFDMSTTQFADTINIQRPSMSHIIAGRNNPSLDFVSKVLKAFPEINPDWLIFGEGKMYRNNEVDKTNLNSNSENEKSNMDLSQNYDLFSSNTTSETSPMVNEPVVEVNETEDYVPYIKAPLIASKSDVESKNHVENSESEKIIHSEELKVPKKVDKDIREISKIVFFYTDKTFNEYFPEI